MNKLIGSVLILLVLSSINCKDEITSAKDGTIYLWYSDSAAAFPIKVNFNINGIDGTASYLRRRVNLFDCNNYLDPQYVDVFASHSERSNVRVYYKAIGKNGYKWAGSTFTNANGCNTLELSVKNVLRTGAFFWTKAANIQYPIHVVFANRDSGYINAKCTRDLTCDSALITKQPYYWSYMDTVGVISYKAKAASGETWEGKVTLEKDHCSAVELLAPVPVPCTHTNLTGTWERQDDGIYPHTKGMKVSYSLAQSGVVSSVPAQCCYKVTDVIWTIMNVNDCSISEIEKNSVTCQYSLTTSTTVKFLSLNLIVVNGVQYKRL